MKTAFIYALLASAIALGLAFLFACGLAMVPVFGPVLDFESTARWALFAIVFGVIPVAAAMGFSRQVESERRKHPLRVREKEHLRPLHLAGLRKTLAQIRDREGRGRLS